MSKLQVILCVLLTFLVACGPSNELYDFDDDGFFDAEDCAPDDSSIYPGAPDSYGDQVDQNCDGGDGIDADGDGYPGNDDLDEAYSNLYDCDDNQASIHPGATDNVGDQRDTNCDGHDGTDNDGDGFASLSSQGDDCDDTDSSINPGAPDPYDDGLDTNCDGGDGIDADGDGYPANEELAGTSVYDCNDANDAVHPGAEEVPDDEIDNDCDGTLEADADLDGYNANLDCNDLDSSIYPNAPEICDGIDQDCDLEVDEDFDGDGDGYFDGSEPSCGSTYMYVDCDDGNPQSNTSLVDGDCDGVLTEDDCDDQNPIRTLSPQLDADCDGNLDCLAVVNHQGLDLSLLCDGTFDMGCTPAQLATGNCVQNELPVHNVTLTRDFWMGVTEVTQGQWEALFANNPSITPSPTGDHPVEWVNWYEALAFANAMSSAEGLLECFTLSGCSWSPGGGNGSPIYECSSVAVNSSTGSIYDCEGYRLPTEAEWQYAARAGTDLVYAGSNTAEDVACFGAQSSQVGTNPVASKQPNGWGLFDMSGNVQELVWDWYDANYYASSPTTDPEGPTEGNYPTVLGGNYQSAEAGIRVSHRTYYYGLNAASQSIGFRIARTAD
jgi:formylglycine-generating enzyme required for sulfatase activity